MAEFLVKYYRSLIFFTLTKEKITDDICNDPKCVLYPMHPGLGLVGGRERARERERERERTDGQANSGGLDDRRKRQ